MTDLTLTETKRQRKNRPSSHVKLLAGLESDCQLIPEWLVRFIFNNSLQIGRTKNSSLLIGQTGVTGTQRLCSHYKPHCSIPIWAKKKKKKKWICPSWWFTFIITSNLCLTNGNASIHRSSTHAHKWYIFARVICVTSSKKRHLRDDSRYRQKRTRLLLM